MGGPAQSKVGTDFCRLPWADNIEIIIDSEARPRPAVDLYREGARILRLSVETSTLNTAVLDSENGLHRLLCERQLLSLPTTVQAQIELHRGTQGVHEVWQIAAPEPLRLDLLCGDEETLIHQFESFLHSRESKTLVAFLRVTADELYLGPVRCVEEAAPPRPMGRNPRRFPKWQARLKASLGLLRTLLEEALNGPCWYILTARGYRISTRWTEAKDTFREALKNVARPPACMPLAYAMASIEGSLPAAGCSEHANTAAWAARCEAWERFCLDRPDLAPPIDADLVDARDEPGIYADYLKGLLPGGKLLPAQACVAEPPFGGGKKLHLPRSWIYLDGDPSVANTNGAAFGATWSDAVQSALQELVERHAFMQVFFGLRAAQVLGPQQGADAPMMSCRMLAGDRKVQWYDLGIRNGLKIVVCALSSPSPPYLSLGAAARSSKADAVLKAFYECASVELMWANEIIRFGPQGFCASAEQGIAQPDRNIGLMEAGRFWAARPQAGAQLEVLFATGSPADENLDLERLLAVDIGTDIVWSGSVVKLYHPEALPLPSCHEHALFLARLACCVCPDFVPMT